MSDLKQAWEYSFIHSSATGRGDEEIGPCLTYEKSVAFGKGCIKQREVFIRTQPEATAPAQDLGATDRADALRWRAFAKALITRIPGPGHGTKIKVVEVCPMYGEEKEVSNITMLIDHAILQSQKDGHA